MRYTIYKNQILLNNKSSIFDFQVDGRVYYTYRITDVTTGEHYYGSRIKVKETILDDFWFYCTSSKRKHLIKENKSNYKVKIIKIFNNLDDMYIFESFLHQKLDVKNNDCFWNQSNQTPFGFNTSGKEFSKKQSDYMNTLIIYDGISMTNAKKHSLKMTSTRKEKITLPNGSNSTSFIEGAKAGAKTKIKKSPHYNIFNIYTNKLLYKNISRNEVRKIHQLLDKKTKVNYLGKSRQSKLALNRNQSLHLQGLYAELV